MHQVHVIYIYCCPDAMHIYIMFLHCSHYIITLASNNKNYSPPLC